MNLSDIFSRALPPAPWEEGDTIPWNDPAFSKRMLKEHLSQAHDAASRRFSTIEKHVSWLQNKVLQNRPTRILDLGCGPGLYATRLSKLGHTCTGIDFSPASIAYAREQAESEGLTCTFHEGDMREVDFGSGYGLVMLLFGEFNIFKPADARLILEKASQALDPGGMLVLEPHHYDYVKQEGNQPRSWYASPGGLWSDKPHLVLVEFFWDEEGRAATTRHYIVDADSGEVQRSTGSMQAYTDEEYRALIESCGFGNVTIYPLFPGVDNPGKALMVITAQKG